MHPRRLLFVDVPHGARPTAIYLAIAVLVIASLLGFVLAAWTDDSAASAPRLDASHAERAGQTFDDGLREAPDSGPRRAHSSWM